MALVFTSSPPPVVVPPTAFVTSTLVGGPPRFRLSLPTFGIGFIVRPVLPGVLIGGKSFRDFPATPTAPEAWVLGCIQNVMSQSLSVTWVDNNGTEVTKNFTSSTQMLDADPQVSSQGVHLPFVRASNGPSLPPCLTGLIYGMPGVPRGIPIIPPSGPGPAWNIATGLGGGTFTVLTTDAPSLSVFAFKGGGPTSGSPNPIVEVTRSLTVQIWLTAVMANDIQDATKHNIVAYTNAITLTGKFDRRPSGSNTPSNANWFHFDVADFTHGAITAARNVGNTTPPARRPVMSGPLSVAPVKTFLKTQGFAA